MTSMTETLTAAERALVSAVASTFFPPSGPIAISGIEAGVPDYFAGYLRRSGTRQAVLIRLLLAFTELSPLMFGPCRRRFTQLSHDQRVRFLDTVRTSRIYFRRVSFVSFRAMMTMAYLANDEVARQIGMVADTDPFGLGNAGCGGGEHRDEPSGEEPSAHGAEQTWGSVEPCLASPSSGRGRAERPGGAATRERPPETASMQSGTRPKVDLSAAMATSASTPTTEVA